MLVVLERRSRPFVASANYLEIPTFTVGFSRFWATHAGAELDLLMIRRGRRVGVEFKRVDAPRLTSSMRIAMRDLRLESLYVVYPGSLRYRLGDAVEAVPIATLAQVRHGSRRFTRNFPQSATERLESG